MDLTKEEEAILYGEQGEGKQKAMELVTALGKIYGADSLIDITSAHLSGASYKTIGDGGLKYLEDLVGGGSSSGSSTSTARWASRRHAPAHHTSDPTYLPWGTMSHGRNHPPELRQLLYRS